MAIKYSEIIDRWPFGSFIQLFVRRLVDVEYDSDSIFIVISVGSLVCVGCICSDHTIFLERVSSWLGGNNILSLVRFESIDTKLGFLFLFLIHD